MPRFVDADENPLQCIMSSGFLLTRNHVSFCQTTSLSKLASGGVLFHNITEGTSGLQCHFPRVRETHLLRSLLHLLLEFLDLHQMTRVKRQRRVVAVRLVRAETTRARL